MRFEWALAWVCGVQFVNRAVYRDFQYRTKLPCFVDVGLLRFVLCLELSRGGQRA